MHDDVVVCTTNSSAKDRSKRMHVAHQVNVFRSEFPVQGSLGNIHDLCAMRFYALRQMIFTWMVVYVFDNARPNMRRPAFMSP
jgi:hypothetical protein